MKGVFQAAVDCALLPAWVTLEGITVEWVDLYRHVPPRGRTYPYPLSHSKWKTWYLRRMILSLQ